MKRRFEEPSCPCTSVDSISRANRRLKSLIGCSELVDSPPSRTLCSFISHEFESPCKQSTGGSITPQSRHNRFTSGIYSSVSTPLKFNGNVSQDSVTVVEASMMLDGMTRKIAVENQVESPTLSSFTDIPSFSDAVEKRRKVDYVHGLLSGRDTDDLSEHSALSTTPHRSLKYAPQSPVVLTPTAVKTLDDSMALRSSGGSKITCGRNVLTEDSSSFVDCLSGRFCQGVELPTSFHDNPGDDHCPSISIRDIVSRYYAYGRSPDKVSDSSPPPGLSPHRVMAPIIAASSTENIRVVIRCRPLDGRSIPVIQVRDNLVEVHKPGNVQSSLDSQRPKVYRYCFDNVFDGGASQLDLFEASSKSLIPKVFEGVNGTVFAYGCTSAGKTYTMLGDEQIDGIVQMSIRYLFEFKEARYAGAEIRFSFLEVYNESVYDLLAQGTRSLDIQEDNGEVRVHNMISVKVDECCDALILLSKGIRSRKMAMTAANRHSSRSHAIMQFVVSVSGSQAKLSFIDLAGSERASGGEGRGERSKESSYINQSLLALANCINGLSEGCASRYRVKYRDSKLTLLLKNSLFSNSMVVMITAIHPGMQFLHESSHTLKYAQRAKNLKVTIEPLRSSSTLEDYMTALNESYTAISIIGRSLPESTRNHIAEVLQSSGLCGSLLFLNLLSFDYNAMTRQQRSPNYISLDTLNALIIDATVDKCASFTNNRILNAIKQRWTSVLRQRMEAINSGAHVTHFDASTITFAPAEEDLPEHVEETQDPTKESTDDEFDDAEVESAQPQEKLDSASVVAEVSKKHAPSDTSHVEGMPPGLRTAPTIEEVEDDISISDISDLDDKESETKDLVIGMLDKITRPSSKKASTPMWKIKLKYGVLQVKGVEIPFENLEGDFEF